MMPTPIDHLLAFLLLVVAPIWSWRGYQRLKRELAQSRPNGRIREYRDTMLAQWAVALAILAWWTQRQRPLPLLGVTLPGGRPLVIGVAVTGLLLFAIVSSIRSLRRLDPARLARARGKVGVVMAILPHNRAEMRWFAALSVTAGVCEELAYRGYLLWYLSQYMAGWVAVILAAVIFGAGHAYQGRSGVVKTGAVGIFMGAFYLLSGSLLWPGIAHAAVDLQGGTVGWTLNRSQGKAETAAAAG